MTDAMGPVASGRHRAVGRFAGPVAGLVPLLLLLVTWQLVGSPNSPFFPAPSSWWPALFTRGQGDAILPAIIDTLRTFALGLTAATLTGTALGLIVGRSRTLDRALSPTLEFARALPPAALVPVATLLMGFDESMKVTVVAAAALWPISLNTRSGVRELDEVLLDTARSLRLTRTRRLFSVLIPSVMPWVVLGIRVATPIALVITLLVEYLTAVNGVGALVSEAQRTFQPARVYALIVIAGLISLAINGVVRFGEKSVMRRRRLTP